MMKMHEPEAVLVRRWWSLRRRARAGDRTAEHAAASLFCGVCRPMTYARRHAPPPLRPDAELS